MVENKQTKEIEEGKVFAFLGVFLSIVGFVIAILAKKENKYVMYYAKQGLVLFIAYIVGWVITLLIGWIPVIGWIITGIIWILLFLMWLIGWINALSGKQKPLIILGDLGEKFKI